MHLQGGCGACQLGDKTAFGLGGVGLIGMTLEHVAPHFPPWIWQGIFWFGLCALVLSAVYLACLHVNWMGRTVPIALMVIGAALFFGGAIWLGIG